ncbi:MAG TPA: hypothetical protein VL949_02280 [Geobacteraceae bacterium]|nr:hypothetical protein [Geobacteraceae bacterium]
MIGSKTCCVMLVLTCLLFLAGCSSTKIVTSWRDDSYRSGTFKKPLVLAIATKQVVRAKLEDELVRELRALGVDAMQSYRIFPEQEGLSADTIKAKLPGTDRDSILVTHLVDVKKETVYVPARTDVYPTGETMPLYYDRFGTYYAQSHSVVSSPGYSYEAKTYMVETNLYNAGNEKLVWTLVTATEEPGSFDAAVKDFVGTVIRGLEKNKVF